MDLTLLLAFWGLTTLLICTPGADWAYLISAGLHGRGAQAVLGMVTGHFAIALAVALGLAAVVAAHAWMLTVISAAGGLYLLWLGASALQSVLQERRAVKAAEIRAAAREDCTPGASSVSDLAVPATVSDPTAPAVVSAPAASATVTDPTASTAPTASVAVEQRLRAAPTKRAAALQGMSVSLLNPKVYLMFLALVPQFVSDSAPLADALQLIVLGLVHVVTCGVIYLAVSLGAGALLTARPRAAAVVTVASGVLMSALGVAVIVDLIL